MIYEELATKLREEYGDDLLETLSHHYPMQFAHIIKTTTYYFLQNEQRIQRDQGDVPSSGLQPEAGN